MCYLIYVTSASSLVSCYNTLEVTFCFLKGDITTVFPPG